MDNLSGAFYLHHSVTLFLCSCCHNMREWWIYFFQWLGKKREIKRRGEHTHIRLGGGGTAKTLKGKRLRGLSKKLAQQEADYTTKGIHFAHLACTNSNKGAWQCAGSWKWGWGSGSRCFFKGNGTFMTMLINCFWDGAPPTPPPAHTPRTAWLGLRTCVYGHMDQYTP